MPTIKEQKEQFLLYRVRVHKDRAAFDELYAEHAPKVLRFLLSKLPKREDAHDALSQTFLRLWNYLLVTEVGSASGLIFTIARGTIAEFYRSRRTGDVSYDVDEVAEQLATDAGASAQRVQARIEIGMLKKALQEFDDESQLAFTLRHFEGLSVREVADRIQKTENATAVMLHRMKKTLQKKFTPNM